MNKPIIRIARCDISHDSNIDSIIFPKGTKLTVLYCFPSNHFVSGVGVTVEDGRSTRENVCASCLITEDLFNSFEKLEQESLVEQSYVSDNMIRIEKELAKIAKELDEN